MANGKEQFDGAKSPTKVDFAHAAHPLDVGVLQHAIDESRSQVGPEAERSRVVVGRPQETAVVVMTPRKEVAAAVRSPEWIPRGVRDGVVDFGGRQDADHIEHSYLRETDWGYVRESANRRLQALRESTDLNEFVAQHGGYMGIGTEPEAFLLEEDGSVVQINAGESFLGQREDALPPIATPREYARARAELILRRREQLQPGQIAFDGSVRPTGRMNETRINMKGDEAIYNLAITQALHTRYAHCADPLTRQVMDQLARTEGYRDFQELYDNSSTITYWGPPSASHAAIGMHHRRESGAMFVPELEAVAHADMTNSDFATADELLMMSTPVVFDQRPLVIYQGNEHYPRDYRHFLRHAVDTTYPAPFVGSPEALREKVADSILSGRSHTLDRSAYTADVDGLLVPNYHGRVRIRQKVDKDKDGGIKQSCRIEETGCSQSASLPDEIARNALMQLRAVAVDEALAAGFHPSEFYAEKYPYMTSWQRQQEIVLRANLFGFRDSLPMAVILENIRLVRDIGERYPVLQDQAVIAEVRLRNLLNDPVDSLEEYERNPRGPFSEVLQNELDKGTTPIELAHKVVAYQETVAEKTLQAA